MCTANEGASRIKEKILRVASSSLKQLQGKHIVYRVSDNRLTPISFNFLDRTSSVTLRRTESEMKTLQRTVSFIMSIPLSAALLFSFSIKRCCVLKCWTSFDIGRAFIYVRCSAFLRLWSAIMCTKVEHYMGWINIDLGIYVFTFCNCLSMWYFSLLQDSN